MLPALVHEQMREQMTIIMNGRKRANEQADASELFLFFRLFDKLSMPLELASKNQRDNAMFVTDRKNKQNKVQ